MTMDLRPVDLRQIFDDNLKKAVSRCQELHKESGNNNWLVVAKQLEGIRIKGNMIANARQLAAKDIEAGLVRQTARAERMAAKEGSKH